VPTLRLDEGPGAAPTLTSIGIAVAEIELGLGTLAGIAPLLLALGGLLVSPTLTLSATWHVHPYFLGSDSMYAVAWLSYGLGVVETQRRSKWATNGKRATNGRKAAPVPSQHGFSRREFLRGASLAVASIAAAGVAASLATDPIRARADGGPPATAASPGSGTAPSTGSSGPQADAGRVPAVQGRLGAQAAPAAVGTPIADLSKIPVGGAIAFEDPGAGSAALVRLGESDVVAYGRVCTHGGALVGYDSSARLLVCPCHGAEFDPAHGAEVVAGSAPSPLAPIDVAVDPSSGKVVLPA
jgi:thiosulfate dehydrogenase [quinone] large subunit